MKQLAFLFALQALVLNSVAQTNPVIIQTKNTETLVPEGIAVDKSSGEIYVTSISEQKIIVINDKGEHRDFISKGKDGFGEGLGIKLDEKRNLVWALSHKSEGKWFYAHAHAFDKFTGKTKYHFVLKDSVKHLFNDLALDDNGNAYITATYSGKLFYADTRTNKLSVFLSDSLIRYPNGIALQKNRLYIATYSSGLVTYDMKEKKLARLPGIINKKHAYNLDGIGFYQNSLFGVFNTDSLNSNNAIVEYKLNDEGTAIIGENIFHKGHPQFHEPTTLAIVSNKLYLLANSHLAVYNANKESVKGIEKDLTPVCVLVYPLE